jgi:hypothetical protein
MVTAGLAAMLAGTEARAGGCPQPWEAAGGPLPAGVGPADFGAIPEACPSHELALRLRGTLLVSSAAPDFYGNVGASATLRYRRPLTARTWVSLAMDAVTFRYVANAVIVSSGPTVGPPTFGLYHTAARGDDWDVAVYGRGLLPLDTARHDGFELGLELGGAGRLARWARAGLQGGLALVAPVDVTGGQAHRYLRPAALVEGWYAPRPWVALAAGAEARAQAAPAPSFTSLAPRLAARFALRHRAWLAALVEVPVAGTDRTDLVAAFYAGWSP